MLQMAFSLQIIYIDPLKYFFTQRNMTNCIAVFDPKASNNIGKISGVVTFHQCDSKTVTVVNFKLSGFQPGTTHGIHIHECGDLTEGCASACSHYSISGHMHGSIALYGNSRHEGDLCNNIIADSNGNVDFSYQDDLVNLTGPHSVAGRSVVIHANPDDLGRYRYEKSKRGEESGKTGNAGARIACAIIGHTNKIFHP